jgi:hypothetical protein
MVCATLGHQSLTPYAKGFSAFHAFISLLVVAFTIIGTSSYSNRAAANYRVPWATVKFDQEHTDDNGVVHQQKVFVDYGLRSFTWSTKIDDKMTVMTGMADVGEPISNPDPAAVGVSPACPAVKNPEVILYKDCAIAECWNPAPGNPLNAAIVEQCTVCKKAGTNSVSALIVAIVFAVIAVIAFFMRTCNDGTLGKDLSIIAVLVSFAFLIAGYASAKPCKDAIHTVFDIFKMAPGMSDVAVTFGHGIKFVTAAWALLLWLIPFALLVPVPQVHEHAPVGTVAKV